MPKTSYPLPEESLPSGDPPPVSPVVQALLDFNDKSLADLVGLYVKALAKRDEMTASVKEVSAAVDAIENRLRDSFLKEGIQNLKAHGRTVYIKRTVYAVQLDPAAREQAGKALFDAGFHDCVKPTIEGEATPVAVRAALASGAIVKFGYDMRSVSALVKSLANGPELPELPDQLAPYFKAQDMFEIASRKA